jgi:hypothetical protein
MRVLRYLVFNTPTRQLPAGRTAGQSRTQNQAQISEESPESGRKEDSIEDGFRDCSGECSELPTITAAVCDESIDEIRFNLIFEFPGIINFI